MNKLYKVAESTMQGIMINGGFYMIMEESSFKAIVVTTISFYGMFLAILFQED